MRVVVDGALCQGVGQCEAIAPDVFEVADDGLVEVQVEAMSDANAQLVSEAVESCPTGALSLES